MIYIPNRGDIIWINFDPQIGNEHSKRRPALVLSKKLYNDKVGLCLVCPITSRKKGYPFEVEIITKKISGVILSDQVKSFDWRARNAEYIDKAADDILSETKQKLISLI